MSVEVLWETDAKTGLKREGDLLWDSICAGERERSRHILAQV